MDKQTQIKYVAFGLIIGLTVFCVSLMAQLKTNTEECYAHFEPEIDRCLNLEKRMANFTGGNASVGNMTWNQNKSIWEYGSEGTTTTTADVRYEDVSANRTHPEMPLVLSGLIRTYGFTLIGFLALAFLTYTWIRKKERELKR